jgi:hypothetical protein
MVTVNSISWTGDADVHVPVSNQIHAGLEIATIAVLSVAVAAVVLNLDKIVSYFV